ncbi:MAG: Cas10/Cmr2 second palm domain-containing protein [Lachnospiraceae bacterium]
MQNGQEVLVMYDIREIQKYIFRTNKVKDIIGASILVEGILEKGISECEKKNSDIKVKRVFIGGGNASVIYKNREEARRMNRSLAKWILEQTYSLQLATAIVERTDDYATDYVNVQKEMARVKKKMSYAGYFGALPIVEREASTGLAITSEVQGPTGIERVSRETYLKREKLTEKGIKFDDLVDQKGEDSTLALVHIDGNSMGKKIERLIKGEQDYEKIMKEISQNINQSFFKAFEEMEKRQKEWAKKTKGEDEKKCYIRKIILAGDDITFVCTAKIALSLVQTFVYALSDKVLYGEKNAENLEQNGFSICAGIAYMHSHFPFRDAYEIAEQCCENAKKRAKEAEHKVDGMIGNWVDFQICRDVQTMYLKENREKNYRLPDGKYLLRRPYYIPYVMEGKKFKEMNEKNQKFSFDILKEQIHLLVNDEKSGESGMVKSNLQELRNTYPLGEHAMDELLTFFKSRNKTFLSRVKREIQDDTREVLSEKPFDKEGIATWYDALEIYELFTDIGEGKENEEAISNKNQIIE